jgi:poly-gamma-glutamate capsule biosynthesis protein CapA/YwtB (metallophosphatase superfamily)
MGYEEKFDLALAPSHDVTKLSTFHAIALQSLAMAKASTQIQQQPNNITKEVQPQVAVQTSANRDATNGAKMMNMMAAAASFASLDNTLAESLTTIKKMPIMPVVDDLSKVVDEDDSNPIVAAITSGSSKSKLNNRKSSSTPVLTKTTAADVLEASENIDHMCCNDPELKQVRNKC